MKKNHRSYKKAAITTVASGLVISIASPYAQAAPPSPTFLRDTQTQSTT